LAKFSKIGNKKILSVYGDAVPENPRYIDEDNPWDEYDRMPHYHPIPPECYAEVKFVVESEKDIIELGKLMDQDLSESTKSTWYPKKNSDDYSVIRYVSDFNESNTPKYPIYIVSKGRFEKRPTSDSLIKMGVKHFIVVESSQYEDYKSRVDPNFVTVHILDQKYLDEYDTFDKLGSTKSKGPGAARNFAWDHSISLGFKRHWVMDDNIQNFYRLDGSKRVIVSSGAIFRAMEDHTDRYDNVYMSGPHYRFFNPPHMQNPPFWLNTRIYSCNLILNDIPFRWRGRYNEDTDISLQILKSGYCTIQYNAFLQGKMVTQAMAGGNTDEFYNKEGTLPKSKMLEDMHPDICRVVWMNGRWHHWCDYSVFKKNRLIKNPNAYYNPDDEYGMKLTSMTSSEKDIEEDE
jgi:hypothetical protein